VAVLPGAIWKDATATGPLAIMVALSPKTRQVIDPELEAHDIDLLAFVAEEPADNVTFEMSVEE
jgi:hypothetical protein